MSYEFKLPFLGENINSGRIVSVLIAVGETMQKDQIILELETDKAVIEVPVDHAGTIEKVMVKDGDDIAVGQTILLMSVSESIPTSVTAPAPEDLRPSPGVYSAAGELPRPEFIPPQAGPLAPPASTATATVTATSSRPSQLPAPAAPSVRRFAREIGVSINEVPGSGSGGRISIEDVKDYSKTFHQRRAGGEVETKSAHFEPLPDFSKWGETDRQPMSKVRETTARHLSYAWTTIPQVTQYDKTDITDLENLRLRFASKAEKTGGKLTITAILLKVVQIALQKFPQFNASIDQHKNENIYKKYFNIGVAVDTERGLLVPVIRNVDKKNILQLAGELAEISVKARERKLILDEMQGGNFTISNLGGIGGTGFSPIVNSPEVAILGVSRARTEPVFQDNQFVPRLLLPLSLSYDHRIIDGADGARFLRWICEALEQPFLLMSPL